MDVTYPALSHDTEGHIWHHDDAMLQDYITEDMPAILDNTGVWFRFAMPAFGDGLGPAEITAILDIITSTWPPRIRQARDKRLSPRP